MSLKYQVKGSAAQPYQITVQGTGAGLRVFCTCPAMRKGGMFCKHVAALLVGDVTNLVHPSDDVEELKRRAIGSNLVNKALKHVPYVEQLNPLPIAPGIETVADMTKHVAPLLDQANLHKECCTGEDGSEILEIYEKFKNGKPRKTPALTLSFEPTTYDLMGTESGEIIKVNHRPRVRPWGVRSKEKANAWSSLERASRPFMEALQRLISSR